MEPAVKNIALTRPGDPRARSSATVAPKHRTGAFSGLRREETIAGYLFLLPNLVLIGAILFTIAALTRQVIPVYLGAIAIFIGYIVAANYWSGIESPVLSAVAEGQYGTLATVLVTQVAGWFQALWRFL